ncbi:MAG: NAD(P)H-binding protein [Gammaproteobacteria bacterium]|nr:NAD(P)H-binding protein [Gammaproteobacteria bacterium]
MANITRQVFITGGSGYLGRALVPALLDRGHKVRAIVRRGSEHKIPSGCDVVSGDTLDSTTLIHEIGNADTFVHLIGVSHPSPSKAKQFLSVDLASIDAAITAAIRCNIKHFVYVSVAQPAPMMRAFVAARAEAERLLQSSGLNVTVLRPWYVLGPGHRWPYVLLPAYGLLDYLPATRMTVRRLGLVTLPQMIAALANAVDTPIAGRRIIDVPAIRLAATGIA